MKCSKWLRFLLSAHSQACPFTVLTMLNESSMAMTIESDEKLSRFIIASLKCRSAFNSFSYIYTINFFQQKFSIYSWGSLSLEVSSQTQFTIASLFLADSSDGDWRPPLDSLIQFVFNFHESRWKNVFEWMAWVVCLDFSFLPSPSFARRTKQKRSQMYTHNMIFAIPVIFFVCLFVPVGRIQN